jgi:nucleoid DNA-binding protein
MAGKAATKSEILTSIAKTTMLSRKQIASVFDSLSDNIKKALSKKGPGIFVVPGLMKVVRVHKPATPERRGINPFTKLETTFAAKPERNVVKVRPLKKLKAMVG